MSTTIYFFLATCYDQATREKKNVKNLGVPRLQNEEDFAYILRIQKFYNISIWLNTPLGEG